MTKWNDGGLLPGRWRLTLAPQVTAPIASDLGLGLGTVEHGPPLVVELGTGLYTDFDFTLGTGVELWRAP